MNSIKTMRLAVAALFLIQGTYSPAVTRAIATQNDVTVETINRRIVNPDVIPDAVKSQTAAPEAVIIHDTKPVGSGDWVENLPGDSKKHYARVYAHLKKIGVSLDHLDAYSQRIAKYLDFLMFNSKKSAAEQEKILFGEQGKGDGALQRLTESSTEFLFCANPNDFSCLEQVPRIKPTADHRVEDPTLKLGEVKEIEGSFMDKIRWYFSEQVFTPQDKYDAKKGVTRHLEKLINDVKPNKDSGIFMALYGIDDIRVQKGESGSEFGSLRTLFDALVTQRKNQVPIFGVFDTQDIHANAPKDKKIILSYQKPKSEADLANWILTPLKKPLTAKNGKVTTGLTNMDFMYNVGTQYLIEALNAGTKGYEDAVARLENPDRKIMHNKFFIFKNEDELTVWTGTGNIARTCLGTERNSNLSVVIRDNNIGKAYMDEFQEMFKYASMEPKDPKKDHLNGTQNGQFPMGKFKKDKSPNTHRLFHYKGDDTYVRVYFSPTDDGEHRAILPMLHSALPGDKLLISMFGATGVEYVRAIQLAAARGVEVRIILDSPTACGVNAWIGLDTQASLLEDNPFEKVYGSASLKEPKIFTNTKGDGESWDHNHQKIGMLLRKQANGSYLPQHMTVGSQNWSEGGNDESDENMIVISRMGQDIPMGSAFAAHHEWLITAGDATPIIKGGCSASTEAFRAAKKKKAAN